MNVDDKNVEPVINLGLTLGYSNQCIEKNLKSDPGAGANAVSGVDTSFLSNGSLPELFWFPQKNSSVKCADGNFSEKKPSLLWVARKSSLVSGSTIKRPINEVNFMASPAAFNERSEIAGRDNSIQFLTNNVGIVSISGPNHDSKTAINQVDELKTAVGASFLWRKEDLRINIGEGICCPVNVQVGEITGSKENKVSSLPDLHEPTTNVAENDTSEEPIVRARDVGARDHILGVETVLASDIKEYESYHSIMQNIASSGKGHEESAPFMEKESKNCKDTGPNCKDTGPLCIVPLERLESTDENELHNPFMENACSMTKNIAAESVHEVKKTSRQDEDILPRENIVAVGQFPTNSRIQGDEHKIDRAKALYDGNVNGDGDNHESVESRIGAGLFLTEKRRYGFEHQLIVGNKRVKRQIQGCPGRSSFIKQDSSFMNWISNMKGVLKSNKDEEPSLSLTLGNHNYRRDSLDRHLTVCNTNQDPRCKTTGFQYIFQSLYRPTTKIQEFDALNANYQTEGSKELELDSKLRSINTTPLACCKVTGNVYKNFLQSTEKLNESTSGNGAIPIAEPINAVAASQEIISNNSEQNKNSGNLAMDKEKDGGCSCSSLCKHKMNSTERIDSMMPSEGGTRKTHNFDNKSNPLASLWMTRFMKTSCSLSNKDLGNKNIGGALDCSVEGRRLKPQFHSHLGSPDEHKCMEAREHSTEDILHVPNHATSTKASFGFCTIKGHHDENSLCKVSPILPSPGLKNSEAMASVFVRRLDALKPVMLSDVADNAACAALTCFFCGIKGQLLQDFADKTGSEPPMNIKSSNGADKLSCVCTKCFQLNHQAVVHPNASTRVIYPTECGASVANECGPSKIRLNAKNKENLNLSDCGGAEFQTAGEDALCDGNDPKMNLNLNWKSNEAVSSGKMKLYLKLLENDAASNSQANKLEENQIVPFCKFVDQQIFDEPKGIFDAVKKLRLSRSNILKWFNSYMPVSHLNGFFLRLRLARWEEGLGGNEYYVACITGLQKESSEQKSKKSLAVNIGGIEFLVESKYVSNHDFLEDELRAWWSATLRSGGKMQSEEDLRSKVEEKKILGF